MGSGEWLILPALVALTASARVGWYFALEVLREEPRTPAWLEGIAPLKGRWLWLLLSSPAILVAMLMTLLGAGAPLLILYWILAILEGRGAVGMWAVTLGSLFFLCRRWPRRRLAPQAPIQVEVPTC